MVPNISDPRWKSLVNGTLTHDFTSVAAGMCVHRNQRKVQKDPSPEIVDDAVSEIHQFFTKYAHVTQKDLNALFS